MSDDVPLRMIAIQLPGEAMKTYRVLNGGNPDLYPVIVGLSRSVDEYERLALKDFGVIREDTDQMWALIEDTTIEAIGDHIDEYNAELDAAVEEARKLREDAEAEDQRICDVAKSLMNKLRRDYGLDALAD
jgi:Na+/phosphate symporter